MHHYHKIIILPRLFWSLLHFDPSMPLLLTAWALLIYGLLALFSVSVHESFTKTISRIAQGKLYGDPSNYYYFFKQLTNLLYVAVAGYIVFLVPLKVYKNKKVLTGLSVLFLLLQLFVFTPRWNTLWGARWWIDIPWLPSIQPVEFFKLGYVFFISWRFVRKSHLLNSISILWKFLILNVCIFLVLALIPDFWSVLVLAPVGALIGLYAGISGKNMLRIFWIGVGWLAIIIRWLLSINRSFCTDVPVAEQPGVCRYSYISNRFEVYFDPQSDESGYNTSWQIRQALIAIGGWGFWGRGYGKWLQKFGYIPEAQSDFIFAAYAEEVGFFGISILLFLYGLLAYIVITRLHLVKDQFFQYVALGSITIIMVGAFVHIGVNIHLLPNTWLTLPFVSYGGTSLMVNIIMIILLYKILYLNPQKIY